MRNYYARQYFKNTKLSTVSSNLIITPSPIHRNLGDHAIIQAELDFLEKEFPELNSIEVPRQFVNYFIKHFKVSKSDIILIHGGGYFGTLYPDEMSVINQILSNFQENKIIVFPQTLYFDNNKDNKMEFHQNMKKHGNITLCVREAESFRIAVESDSFKDVLLVPDIVLYNEPNRTQINSFNNILLVLRSDSESIIKFNHTDLIDKLTSKNYIVKKTDTVAPKSKFILPGHRAKLLDDKLAQFLQSDLIITDRLHGMIFSYMSGKPCIAIDNITGKSSGVYDLWLKNNSNITMMKNNPKIDDIETALKNYSPKSNTGTSNIHTNFSPLIKIIEESISSR